MSVMQRTMMVEEINALKVLRSMYQVNLASTNARIGHLTTDLMFLEAEELEVKNRTKEVKSCSTEIRL